MSHTDALAAKFAAELGFKSSADRVQGEQDIRSDLVARELKFYHSFLDDYLGGILPNDLHLLGAFTGAGKTELARIIACANAIHGRSIYYFALEAEPDEIERRTKYVTVMMLARQHNVSTRGVSYRSWYRLQHEDTLGRFGFEAEQEVARQFKTLHTYYRGSKFTHEHIEKLFLAVQSQADLIILDHLHYVDIEDENENRGLKRVIQMIREVSIDIGKPVLLIAHLRKRDSRSKDLVPDIEMFHGSSDIIKICTSAIMLAPAYEIEPSAPGRAPTFIHVPKERGDGKTGLVAMCEFDRQFRNYGQKYTLGRIRDGEFQPLGSDEAPAWAKRHKPLSVPMLPTQGGLT